MVLQRRMWRDIWKHKGQFLSVFLMAFMGVYVFTGMSADWRGLRQAGDEYYQETVLADAFVTGNMTNDDLVVDLKKQKVIGDVERRLVLPSVIDLSGNKDVTLYFPEKDQICIPKTASGEPFRLGESDKIWLNERFASENGLKIGDKVKVKLKDMDKTLDLTLAGTIFSSEYIYFSDGTSMTPDHKNKGFAWLDPKVLDLPGDKPWNQILIRKKDDTVSDVELEDAVDAVMKDEPYSYMSRADHPSIRAYETEVDKHKLSGEIFPVVFLIIALLTLVTGMSRMVSQQRIQIGTMRALGFSRSRVYMYYLSFGFWISLIGSVAGAILGPISLPKAFRRPMMSYYTMPEWISVQEPSYYLIAVVVVVLCSLLAALSCRSVLKEIPAAALTCKKETMTRFALIERIPGWQKTSFNLRWNVRDMSKNKLRSIMVLIGVVGCAILLSIAFTMKAYMVESKHWTYDVIDHYGSKIQIDDATDEEIDTAIKELDGQTLREVPVQILADGKRESGQLSVYDDVTLVTPTGADRRPIPIPKEGVGLSTVIAERYGLKPGDTIEWRQNTGAEVYKDKITCLYRDPSTRGLIMSRQAYEKHDLTYRPTAILSPLKDEKDLPGMGAVLKRDKAISDWDELMSSMNAMVFMLVFGAVILSIVVMYNLGLLSFTEKEREFATLRVLGFPRRAVRRLMLTQNVFLSFLGYLIGLPLGIALLDAAVKNMRTSMDFVLVVTPENIILTFLITVGLAFLVTLMFSRKIRRIDMAQSLKSGE